MVSARCERSFEHIESMPPGLRECVHEYGYAIVKACMQAGVSSPNAIHQLVREIWEGARQPGQRRKTGGTLDWLLIQAGVDVPAATIFRVLDNASLVVVPRYPTREMIDASAAEVSGFNVRCTKSEKHKRRLAAAIKVGGDFLRHKLRRSVTDDGETQTRPLVNQTEQSIAA